MIKSVTLLLVLLIVTNVMAKNRTGVIGEIGGLFSPYAHWQSAEDGTSETKPNIGLTASIGYGFSATNQLYLGLIMTYRKSDYNDGDYILQDFLGIDWHHYLPGKFHRFYTSTGIGRFTLLSPKSNMSGGGTGFELGLGYELKDAYNVALKYVWGKVEIWGDEPPHDKISNRLLSIVLSMKIY